MFLVMNDDHHAFIYTSLNRALFCIQSHCFLSHVFFFYYIIVPVVVKERL